MHCCPSGNVYEFVVDQGASLVRAITLKNSAKKPVNLTGYTGRMYIRETIPAADPIEVLTSANGRVSIDGAKGTITLVLPHTQTALLEPKEYVFDVELEETSTGQVSRVLHGTLTVRAEVTR